MHELARTTPARQLMRDLWAGDRSRLLGEIAHPAHRDLKEGVKAREALRQGILQKRDSDGGPRE
ncbi:MAG TPA: hypothetical protein VMD08_07925 [Candidatus Baltobacteraceae bacterium]|nr:hypothetical protein [Candidatus Baltobacteraceae bacterium]